MDIQHILGTFEQQATILEKIAPKNSKKTAQHVKQMCFKNWLVLSAYNGTKMEPKIF